MKKRLLILLITSFYNQAAIYKCDINGVLTFSQQPCGPDAQLIKIKTQAKSSTKTNSIADTDNGIDDFLKEKGIDRQIKHHQLTIKKYQDKKKSALMALNNLSPYAANRRDLSLDEMKTLETKKINTHYSQLIKREKQKIKKLQYTKSQLK